MRDTQRIRPAVIVTGGANGIGEAIARVFLSAGHPVAIVDRDERGCRRMSRWAMQERLPLLAVTLDVTEYGQHHRAVQRIRRHLGPVGILVNAAGVGASRSFSSTTLDDFSNVQSTNVQGPFFFTQTVAKTMRRGGGSILFLTSVHQDVPVGDPTYSMSKAALKVLVKELALELASARIRVNGIAPGAIRNRPSVDRRFSRVPLGRRRGTSWEIASVAYFLASDAASYITGELITVDGGLSLVNWIATEGMQA